MARVDLERAEAMKLRRSQHSPMTRLWLKVRVGDPDECWPWLARTDRWGYGKVWWAERMQLAHRVIWQLAACKDAGDLFVCHHCDNPAFCNPRHLFIGTNGDNVRDSVKKGRHVCSKKTHCLRGHPFDSANTFWKKDGGRQCRACLRMRDRARALRSESPEEERDGR